MIALIPREPLRAQARYKVTINAIWNGAPRTWVASWTTMPRTAVDATNDDAIFAAVRKPVLLRGTVERATKITEGTALVNLRTAGSKRVLQVSIEAPLAQVGAVPMDLRGKRVEAEGTLQFEYGSARVAITPASPLRILP
jgi:hypothetical protein